MSNRTCDKYSNKNKPSDVYTASRTDLALVLHKKDNTVLPGHVIGSMLKSY